MLKASNIKKHFGDRAVLDGVSFVVNRGECAGIVAPNGAGKSTLLDIIAGRLAADAGSVEAAPGARLAFVRQGYAGDAGLAVADVFPRAFASVVAGEALEAAARALADARGAALEDAQVAYEAAVEAAAGGDGGAAALWEALRLRRIEPGERVCALSGGEQTKLGLIEAFAASPDVLLLDEPTNNLDAEATAWLDEQVAMFEGPVLLVSHDRALLDDHADVIIELDAATGRATEYAGDYTAYAAEKRRLHEAQMEAWRKQVERERKVEREIRAIKDTASRRERSSQNDFYRRKAKKVARRGVVLERRLRREIDGAKAVRPIARPYRLKADLGVTARGGDRMVSVEGVRLEAGGRVLLDGVALSVGWGERLAIVGANGTGKTTMLRAIAGEVRPASGEVKRSPSAAIGYLPQEEPRALAGTTPLSALRAAAPLSETEARRFLHRFLFEGDAAFTPVTALSYGERRRLSLGLLVLGGANMLLLDEPTNHLDIASREALEEALEAYEGAMVAVTHDRYFIERFAQRVLVVEAGVVREGGGLGGSG